MAIYCVFVLVPISKLANKHTNQNFITNNEHMPGSHTLLCSYVYTRTQALYLCSQPGIYSSSAGCWVTWGCGFHKWVLGAVLEELELASSTVEGEEVTGGGAGASFLGGMRSFMASSPLASSKDVILWLGENPAIAAKEIRNIGKALRHTWENQQLARISIVNGLGDIL